MRRLYDWVLSWAHTPYGPLALAALAFAESSFFPVPPDVLLIALAISIPARAFRFGLVTSLGSVAGGVLGYGIGLYFMELIGYNIIQLYGLTEKYDYVQTLYRDYDAWAVGIAGFTPIPYKAFTITAGAFEINFWVFLAASAVSRSARFFIISALIYRYGASIGEFIDRYFNILTMAFVVLLAAGFLALKFFT